MNNTDTHSAARAAIDALVARDKLDKLARDDYERLVGLYDDTQTQLASLSGTEFAETEPAMIYRADGHG
jgi:hypothetical protein